MSRNYLTALIGPQEIYSDGQYKNDCEPPCSRLPWDDESGIEGMWVQVDDYPRQTFLLNGTELLGPGIDIDESKLHIVMRQICHLLVERLDVTGLNEACQSLAEYFDYYRPKPPISTLTRIESNALQGSVMRRLLPSVESLPFKITED